MKIFKSFIFISTAMFISIFASAQLTRDLHKLYDPAYFYQTSDSDSSSFQPWLSKAQSKPSYSIEVGTSFSSFGGGLSTSYISPTVSFMATERLHIVAGGKFSHTNFGSVPFLSSEVGQSQQLQSAGNPSEAFAYGHYQVTDKISVYGMGAFGKNQIYFSPFQSNLGSSDYQHVSFGMDYKISDRVRVGASFGLTNGPAWGVSPYGGVFNQNRMNPFFP